MTHADKVPRWLDPRPGTGVEIGALKSPIPGIAPIYVDRYPPFDAEKVFADYWGSADALPFRDSALAYVATSHVLEHTANPVAALCEWARVTRHGGILYLVVPDHRYTFDHTRPLTAPAHMIDDYNRGTTPSDATHISDYLDGLDWSRWDPAGTPERHAATREQLRTAYLAAVAAGEEINIHFHVFSRETVTSLLALMNARPRRPCTLTVIDSAEKFPTDRGDGFLLVLRVAKPFRARWRAWRDRRHPALLPTARPFLQSPHR
ncbi:MAG: methyltransferase domain-containing protein [Undibacterium sp.]|nr:methyltransferase domain-containing protein [Opitutaceae bacterium]